MKMPAHDPPNRQRLSRRRLLEGLAVAPLIASGPGLGDAALAAASGGLSDAQYARMTVIDGLCFLRENGKNIGPDAPVSPAYAAAIRGSGLTAISTTVAGVNVAGRDLRTLDETKAFIARMDAEIARRSDLLLKVERASDLDEAKRSRRMGVIYNTQGVDELNGNPDRVAVLAGLGVRIFQLTYNFAAHTGDGGMEPRNAGLTTFGRDVIAAIEAQKGLLDLSHVGRRTTAEAIAAATRPCAITHAGCNALTPHPRNVDDAEIRAIAEKGGTFGVYVMPMLRASGQTHNTDVIAHLEHALNVAGEDHVSIGTDSELQPLVIDEALRAYTRRIAEERFKAGVDRELKIEEVYRYVPEWNVPNRFQRLGDELIRRGHSLARVEKILGGNLARLFSEVWA